MTKSISEYERQCLDGLYRVRDKYMPKMSNQELRTLHEKNYLVAKAYQLDSLGLDSLRGLVGSNPDEYVKLMQKRVNCQSLMTLDYLIRDALINNVYEGV